MIAFVAQSDAQGLAVPRPSPSAELKQTIGLNGIVVNYSWPQVIANGQDRTGKIWGGPAWYGFVNGGNSKMPWRAGGNENTTITGTVHADVFLAALPVQQAVAQRT